MSDSEGPRAADDDRTASPWIAQQGKHAHVCVFARSAFGRRARRRVPRRRRRGERPTVDEYAARYPDLAGEIREFFPVLGLVEDFKPGTDDVSGSIGGPVVRGTGVLLERLGDFRLLREVGRGGMGIVYEAEQESLGRRVALKVLRDHRLLDPKTLIRFHREAKAAARLHHTNIVPVFGVGETEGIHFYVMQFIPGLPLDAVLKEVRRHRGLRRRPAARAGVASRFARPRRAT